MELVRCLVSAALHSLLLCCLCVCLCCDVLRLVIQCGSTEDIDNAFAEVLAKFHEEHGEDLLYSLQHI